MPALPNAAASAASPDLTDFRDALTARLAPADAVERHWVGEITFALWQQQRLRAVTDLALAAAEGGTSEPETQPRAEPERPRLPSLATLARYRACIERDLRLAQHELETARQSRPRLPSDAGLANPARLRWLADRIEAGLADRAPANDTGEPEAQPRAEPEAQPRTESGAAAAPASRPLNRHERRRLEALGRRSPESAAALT